MSEPSKPSIWLRVHSFMDRPWYVALVGGLAALDLFIMIIPTDGLLVTSVLVRPKRWVSWFLWVSIGSAVGAAALAAIIHWDPLWLKESLLYGAFQTEYWRETEVFISKHGTWALVLTALSILPQQPAVAIAAFGGMSVGEIFFAVLLGRGIKYLFLSYIASKSPKYLKRIWFVRKELERFQR